MIKMGTGHSTATGSSPKRQQISDKLFDATSQKADLNIRCLSAPNTLRIKCLISSSRWAISQMPRIFCPSYNRNTYGDLG